MLEIKDVSKIYPIGDTKVVPLEKVSLQVEKGGFVAVVGPSGSGKSTLLYTIGGLLTPTSGEVLIGGTSIYDLDGGARAQFRRENLGFIFQTFELLPYLTAVENVMVPLYLSGSPREEQETLALEALEKVGLGKRANHKPTELSGGEQQRVAVARGIVNKPALLLADEPTGNLDQHTGNDIMKLLCDLHEQEALTLVFVTHAQAKAKLAGRVVEMLDGHIVTNKIVN
jgi:putative ABC transport system ATP-binding protein